MVDGRGVLQERQDTDTSSKFTPADHIPNGGYVEFNETIHLQTEMEKLLKCKGVIFLQFMHYKMKAKKTSCHAWIMITCEDIAMKMRTFEIYKKPVHYRMNKSKMKLASALDLYGHARIKVHQHDDESWL